jgi:hypothetical protein
VGRAADLCGLARLRALLHCTPAAECDRLFRLEPLNRWRGAALDGILSRYCELTVLGQHLQRRTVKPDPAYFTPQCTIEVDRRPAPPVLSAPLQRGIAPEGVSKRTEPPHIQATGQTLGLIFVEPLQLIGDRSEVSRFVFAHRRPLAKTSSCEPVCGLNAPPMAAGFICTTQPSANGVTAVSYVWFTPTTMKPWLASSSAISLSSSGGKPLVIRAAPDRRSRPPPWHRRLHVSAGPQH